ncbi:MAG: MaoC family dehydratase [Lachnospiraceae bacterium]|nr:MaoC family dehydratase [Lachnospiraceae bacterium]
MEYSLGDMIRVKKLISKELVEDFARISGDNNPLHLNENVAKSGPFGKCIAHGMISASLISAILGTQFPGEGTIYMGQNLKFSSPVYVNEEVEFQIEIIEFLEKGKAKLRTDVFNGQGVKVIEGEALVKLPNLSKNIN